MNFLLVGINSKYIHSNPAIYSLKASVSTDRHECVQLAEYTINQSVEYILSDIFAKKPGYVAFSCYIWNWSVVEILLEELPKILPDTIIFLGGPEVSYRAADVLNSYPSVTAVMVGEGELTFRELIDSLPEDNGLFKLSLLDSISGIMTKNGYSGDRELLDIGNLPFFYSAENASLDSTFENRIIYYESSRGCPFRCSYCLSSIDKTLRMRDIEQVKEHLNLFLSNKVPQVKFIDRTFNASKEHAMAIWQHILDNDNGITNFHFEIAADIMSDEQIELISRMRPGLVQLEIGVQSTNETTLRAINRYVNIDHIREVTAKLLKPHNAHVHLDLIAGLPYEDYDSFIKSFNDVFNMNPHQLQLGFLKVLHGTEIEARAEEFGIKSLSTPPYEVLSTNWIGYDEILILKGVCEMVETFYNSAQFTQTIPLLLEKYDSPYNLFKALADYYQEMEYTTKTPARSKRYDILLEFASRFGESFVENIRETLTMDYYLREKPKAKPAFVKNIPDLSRFDYEHRDPITYNATL